MRDVSRYRTERPWRRFVRRYGWRAYAVPILTVITVIALVDHKSSTAPSVAPAALARPAAGSSPSAPSARSAQSAQSAQSAATPPTHPARPRASAGRVVVEGLTHGDATFHPASTPTPSPSALSVNLGDDGSSCAQNSYDHLVLVSISAQHLWACDRGTEVRSSAVTTGAVVDGDQTPLGSWRVQDRQRDRYLVGPGYKDYVHFWVPFNGDFGLHDAPWQTMPFGSSGWRTKGSHGCVHVPTTTIAWLYQWVTVGQTVVTIES